jgi:hypothetical protein
VGGRLAPIIAIYCTGDVAWDKEQKKWSLSAVRLRNIYPTSERWIYNVLIYKIGECMNLNDLKLLKSPMHCRKATATQCIVRKNYNVIYERTISRPRSTLTGGAFDIASHLPALFDVTPSNTCWLYSFKQATDNSSFSLRSTNGRCNIIEPCIRFSAAKLHSQSWCSASKPLFNTVFSASSLEIGPSVTDDFFEINWWI